MAKVKDLESCTEAKQEGSSQDKDSSDIVEEDWLDIFGNGQLRKKVRTKYNCFCNLTIASISLVGLESR